LKGLCFAFRKKRGEIVCNQRKSKKRRGQACNPWLGKGSRRTEPMRGTLFPGPGLRRIFKGRGYGREKKKLKKRGGEKKKGNHTIWGNA